MPLTHKDIPEDEMPLKIPDHILLKQANVENGKLKAYIDELEDKIERMKVDAFAEIGIDLAWLSSCRPKERVLKKEIMRLASILSGKKAGLIKEVQSLRRKVSVFEQCGNINDVMSAVVNQKVLAKRVKQLEAENHQLRTLLHDSSLKTTK